MGVFVGAGEPPIDYSEVVGAMLSDASRQYVEDGLGEAVQLEADTIELLDKLASDGDLGAERALMTPGLFSPEAFALALTHQE